MSFRVGCEDVNCASRRIEGLGPKLKVLNLHDSRSDGGDIESGEGISSSWYFGNEECCCRIYLDVTISFDGWVVVLKGETGLGTVRYQF